MELKCIMLLFSIYYINILLLLLAIDISSLILLVINIY